MTEKSLFASGHTSPDYVGLGKTRRNFRYRRSQTIAGRIPCGFNIPDPGEFEADPPYRKRTQRF